MKKLLSVTMVLIMLVLTACSGGNQNNGGNSQSDATNKLEQIKQSGKLVVGTSADYPPFEFHAMIDGKDEIVGFDIEIAKKIAEHLGVELEVQDMGFDAVLAGVGTGLIDIGVAGINKSEEREAEMDFSEVYYKSKNALVIKADSDNKFATIEDLAGKTVGVQIGTMQEEMSKEKFTQSTSKSLAKVTDLILELQTGLIDAVLLELPVAQSYVAQNPDLKMGELIIEEENGGTCVITANGETELMVEINKVIKELIETDQINVFVKEANELAEKSAK